MPSKKDPKTSNSKTIPRFFGTNTKASDQANVKPSETSEESTDMTTRAHASSVAPAADSEVMRELVKMSKLIKDTSEAQDKKLDDIRRSTSAVEIKMGEISERLNHVEGRLGFLEDANKALQDKPLATREEVEQLRDKLDQIENRERRNNLIFIGFPDLCEGSDAREFLREAIQKLWNIPFPEGLEIDRAHRIGARRQSEPNQTPRSRPLIARFLRYQDRDRIADAARKEKASWNGHGIMVFPDYSKIVNDKRRLFNECKKLLHGQRLKFSLMFPALLVIHGPGGRREFDDPKKAMAYIRSLG